jgi:hypothetical protein
MFILSSCRGLAPLALSLVVLLGAISCVPENPTRKTAVPAPPRAQIQTADDSFLEGKETAGVGHVLAVLKSLQSPDRGSRRVRFEFSEAEMNEYLAYSLRLTPRPGIRKLSVRLNPDNAFSVRTVMDFGAIQKWHAWILPDVLKAIASSEPVVEMEVKFQAQDSYGTFKLMSVGGLGGALPADAAVWVIQAIGLHQQEYYDTVRPIPLPFGLSRIWTGQGSVSGDTGS